MKTGPANWRGFVFQVYSVFRQRLPVDHLLAPHNRDRFYNKSILFGVLALPKSIPMQYHDRPASCMNCCEAIAVKDLYHSSAQYGYPLCDSCQQELKPRLRQSSRAATRLYFSLRKMGIKAELEKFDGYKTVDIAVKDARLHIEVEAPQHHYNPFEAMANLQKDCFTFKKGYNTLHVPSALIAYNLESTVSYIADFIRVKQLSRF